LTAKNARNIGFDGRATGIYRDCEYVWEQLEDTQENLIAKFPKKKKEIEQIFGQDKTPKSKIRYIEFWGGGMGLLEAKKHNS